MDCDCTFVTILNNEYVLLQSYFQNKKGLDIYTYIKNIQSYPSFIEGILDLTLQGYTSLLKLESR